MIRSRRIVRAAAVGGVLVVAAACGSDESPGASAPPDTEPSATTIAPETQYVASDAIAVAENYFSSYADQDGDAFLTLVTDDYRYIPVAGGKLGGAQVAATAQARSIATDIEQLNWTIELLSDFSAEGVGPFTVTVEQRVDATLYPSSGMFGSSTLTIVDDAGTLKVSRHVYGGDPL